MNIKQVSKLFLVLSLAGIGAAAQAASTWAFTGVNGGAATTSYTSSSEGTLKISGAYATSTTSSSTYLNTGSASTLLYWNGNGLGMASDGASEPNHAIDNVGNKEMVLLSFSQSVVLTSVGIGYVSGDSDISIFRLNSTVAPDLSKTVSTAAGLTAAGWSLVGNYADLGKDVNAPYTAVNGANGTAGGVTSSSVGSSYWLIMAYSSVLSGTTASGSLSDDNDYFKLFGVTTAVCAGSVASSCGTGGRATVPEPASLALVSVALAGVVGIRRRKPKAVA